MVKKTIFLAILLLAVVLAQSDRESTVSYKTINLLRDSLAQEKFMPTCCGKKVDSCNKHLKYRTFDGSCNNLENPTWGIVNDTFYRVVTPRYADGLHQPRKGFDGNDLPSARLLRTTLFPVGVQADRKLTLNAMQFGQFIVHDMSRLHEADTDGECCTEDGKFKNITDSLCFPISIPPTDNTMGKAGIECMSFRKAITDRDIGCFRENKPAKQLNIVTSYMDMSLVYALNEEEAKELRILQGGLLKSEFRDGVEYLPPATNDTKHLLCNCLKEGDSECYRAGDLRVNQSPQLAILHTIFMREHNRIATELAGINPHWDDERVYQEARRINIAAYQHISLYEWLPIFLGREFLALNGIIFPESNSFIDDYDPKVNPGVSDAHAQAAIRLYHTSIADNLNKYNQDRQQQTLIRIRDFWENPKALGTKQGIEQLTIGLATQGFEKTDLIHADAIANHLYNCEKTGFGVDLKALDIQRDRDFGLGYYNDYRRFCGLSVATSFDDYADLIPIDKVELLKSLYSDYRDVDVSVGGLLEELVSNTQTGPTFRCLMAEQFLRTRRSDRFWFESPGSGFSIDQLAEIRKASMSRIFCDSGDGIKSIQINPFATISTISNPIVPCENFPTVNLAAWKEEKEEDNRLREFIKFIKESFK